MPEWYPILLNLQGRTCMIVGGGTVAERKAVSLLEAGATVRVVSPTLTPTLAELAREGAIERVDRAYCEGDLAGAAIAFVATDDHETNAAAIREARQRGIFVNAADSGMAGDFIVPAIVRRGDLVLTASASGAGPAVASRIAGELAERYGARYEPYLKTMRRIREIVKAHVEDSGERRRLLAAAASEEWFDEWADMRIEAMDPMELIERIRVRALGGKG